MTGPDVLRLTAFSDDPAGGNPAGVVLDAAGLRAEEMLRIAAEVGYSETAFLVPGDGGFDVRYFSPQAEVPFCGHATIASGVALGDGDHVFRTRTGEVRVHVRDGEATLLSADPHVERVPAEALDRALELLGWTAPELDPAMPPRFAFAGARHLILAAGTRGRLDDLDYDFDGLRAFMLDHDLTTVDLVWRCDETTFLARNPFPVGGAVEDPATGAAAAAFGAYLRELGLVAPPAELTIHQGEHVGRPSRLTVRLEPGRAAVAVSGRAVAIHA